MTGDKKNRPWIKQGISFGLFMYVFMSILFPLITKDEITLRNLLISLPIWIVGGLIYGYLMKRYQYIPKGLKKKDDQEQ
jgi:hypothetical protein